MDYLTRHDENENVYTCGCNPSHKLVVLHTADADMHAVPRLSLTDNINNGVQYSIIPVDASITKFLPI